MSASETCSPTAEYRLFKNLMVLSSGEKISNVACRRPVAIVESLIPLFDNVAAAPRNSGLSMLLALAVEEPNEMMVFKPSMFNLEMLMAWAT